MQISPVLSPLKSSELTNLTELWNANLPRDTITEELLYEKTFGDPDFHADMTLTARSAGNIVSFMQGLLRTTPEGEKIGFIKLFLTVNEHRRQGLARQLLLEIESQLQAAGATKIRMMDSNPNYLLPGIDPFYTEAVAFCERLGYEKFDDTSNLLADLHQDFDTGSQEKALALDGIEIRRAEPGDREHVLSFIGGIWPPWAQEVDVAFSNDPISLHLAFDQGRPRAFSAYDVNNKNTGWFGPMGTDPTFRGRGVGGILLKRCLQDMKNQGHGVSIIPWVGPIPFYMHYAGARVHRVFWRYQKVIGGLQL